MKLKTSYQRRNFDVRRSPTCSCSCCCCCSCCRPFRFSFDRRRRGNFSALVVLIAAEILNGISAATTTAAAAAAGERPMVQRFGYEKVIQDGRDVQFMCNVSGNPRPFFLWYKDNEILQRRGQRFSFQQHLLRIKSVRGEDAGQYICCAKNSHGEACTNFSLVVTKSGDPPHWTDDMDLSESVWEVAGKTVQLRCPATGNPLPGIRWLKDGQPFNRRPLGSIRLLNSKFTLRLSDVNTYDVGFYTCVVYNSFGYANWTRKLDVIVRLPHPPIITDGPKNQSATVGESVTFKCRLLSDPEYHLQWLKHIHVNNSYATDNMSSSARVVNAEVNNENPFLYGADLIINNVRTNDTGLYTCVAASILGMNHLSGWLTVLPATDLTAIQPANSVNTAANSEYFIHISQASLSILILLVIVSLSTVFVLVCFLAFRHCQRSRRHRDGVTQQQTVANFPASNNSTSGVVTTAIATENRCPLTSSPSAIPIGSRKHGHVVTTLLRCNPIYSTPKRDRGKGDKVKATSMMLRSEVANPTAMVTLLGSKSKKKQGSSVTHHQGIFQFNEQVASMAEYEIPRDEQWEFPRDNLRLGNVLGEGAFGIVVQAEAYGIGGSKKWTTVAVKMLKADAGDKEMMDLMQEMETMKAIGHHENVLGLLGCCTQGGPLHVVMEFAPHGNLRDFLRQQRPPLDVVTGAECEPSSAGYSNVRVEPSLSEAELMSFALQVARGLQFLTSKMCVHRDVAARNVLVAADHRLKIADFGLTRTVPNNDYYKKMTDGRLPVKWMAPESLFDRKCTVKSDVWSYGILLWEIFSMGGNPYPSVPVEKLFELLQDGHRMEKPAHASQEMYGLMLDCWRQNPKQRPSFSYIVHVLESLTTPAINENYLELKTKPAGLSVSIVPPGGVSENDSQYSSSSSTSTSTTAST